MRLNSKSLFPFILSLGGIITDYITTVIGLSLGFTESHPQYSPINAIIIFWGCIALLHVTLPKSKIWRLNIQILALVSYLGTINNLLVLLPHILSL